MKEKREKVEDMMKNVELDKRKGDDEREEKINAWIYSYLKGT